MDSEAQRGRQEQLRSAKRALRQFQRRRAQEQGKRASRTLRASVLVRNAEAPPTVLTQYFTASNHPGPIARESAVRATDKTKRRRSRPSTIYMDEGPFSRRTSQICWSGSMEGGDARHPRQGSVSSSRLPTMSAGHRLSLARQSLLETQRQSLDPAFHDGPRRRSRHSRQLSISTRGQGFEVLSGQSLHRTSMHQDASTRRSIRFSALEPASILFGMSSVHKPLPPAPSSVPTDWKAELRGMESDDREDRETALDKLEGRRPPSTMPTLKASDDQRRSIVPSWLSMGDAPPTQLQVPKRSGASKRQSIVPIPPPMRKETPECQDPRDEMDRTPRPSGPETAVPSAEAPRSPLRPLRLSSLSTARRPSTQASHKAARRVSSITYKASYDNDLATPTRAWSDLEQKHHQPSSSRGVLSAATSWATSDQTQSLFSPDSNVSDSPGATSIDSTDHTSRKRGFRMEDHLLASLHARMDEQRERHQQELTSLQRELEEVRQVMGSQLVAMTGAKDAAEKELAELQKQVHDMGTQLEDTSGERDMYKEDIVDWRSRCSDLEHTIQSQQLRLDQEWTWRRVATKRMQAMSHRLQADTSVYSDESQASPSASGSMSLLEALPELPELPSEDELGLWTQRVTRQLSKHAPNSDAPDLAPETVKLLTDMREQILALYSALRLEESNHALTRDQLRDAQSKSRASDDAQPTMRSLVLDMPTPTPAETEALEPFATVDKTSGTDAQDTAADILFPGTAQDDSAPIGLGFSSPPHEAASLRSAEVFSSHDREYSDESLGLATSQPHAHEPETPKDSADLFHTDSKRASGMFSLTMDPYAPLSGMTSSSTTSQPAWPDVDTSHTVDAEGEAADAYLQGHIPDAYIDLEGGVMDDSAWVDEEDVSDAEQPDDLVSSPSTPRPEFIPEWSFEQAVFEANRDMQLYKASGKSHRNKYARRGARRMRQNEIEDFFGIFDVATDTITPLPVPDYALDMPPVDTSKLLPAWEYPRPDQDDGTCAPSLDEPWQTPKRRPQPVKTTSPMDDVNSKPVPSVSQTLSELASSSWTSESYSDGSATNAPVPEIQSFDATQLVDDDMLPCAPNRNSLLAPAIPAPCTPIPRSPGDDSPSPLSPGRMRLVKHNPLTRIPVPTPIWKLDFELTTAVPHAPQPFTI